jgi:hypothetical protein
MGSAPWIVIHVVQKAGEVGSQTMLPRLEAVAEERPFTSTIDGDLPLEVSIAPGILSADELFHWRSTGDRYLFELEIVAATGAISGVELVLVPKEWIRGVDELLEPATVEGRVGVPVLDRGPWIEKTQGRELVDPSRRVIDVDLPFVFAAGPDEARLLFPDAGLLRQPFAVVALPFCSPGRVSSADSF